MLFSFVHLFLLSQLCFDFENAVAVGKHTTGGQDLKINVERVAQTFFSG